MSRKRCTCGVSRDMCPHLVDIAAIDPIVDLLYRTADPLANATSAARDLTDRALRAVFAWGMAEREHLAAARAYAHTHHGMESTMAQRHATAENMTLARRRSAEIKDYALELAIELAKEISP